MKKQKGLIIAAVAAGILSVTGIGVYATGQLAQSNSISADSARNFAYVDAGISPDQAKLTRTEFDYEHGKFVYEIEFYTEDMEYDYVIDASNGRILGRETEARAVRVDPNAQNTQADAAKQKPAATPKPTVAPAATNTQEELIDIQQAKELALQDAGLQASDVTFSKARRDTEDGRTVYDVEFYINGVSEYEYEIDALTGEIREKAQEPWEADDIYEVQAAQQNTNTSTNQTTQTPSRKETTQQVTPAAQSAPQQNATQTTPSTPQQTAARPATVATPAPQKPAVTAAPQPAPAQNVVHSGDDIYKQEGGVVYEYDDGRWEAESDKKIENGTVYEYDDGRWEADDDDRDDDDWDDDDDD